MTKPAPEADTPNSRTLVSVLNTVFFVIVLVAMAIGGIFLAVNKL